MLGSFTVAARKIRQSKETILLVIVQLKSDVIVYWKKTWNNSKQERSSIVNVQDLKENADRCLIVNEYSVELLPFQGTTLRVLHNFQIANKNAIYVSYELIPQQVNQHEEICKDLVENPLD